jgi:hypothetical protein
MKARRGREVQAEVSKGEENKVHERHWTKTERCSTDEMLL